MEDEKCDNINDEFKKDQLYDLDKSILDTYR